MEAQQLKTEADALRIVIMQLQAVKTVLAGVVSVRRSDDLAKRILSAPLLPFFNTAAP